MPGSRWESVGGTGGDEEAATSQIDIFSHWEFSAHLPNVHKFIWELNCHFPCHSSSSSDDTFTQIFFFSSFSSSAQNVSLTSGTSYLLAFLWASLTLYLSLHSRHHPTHNDSPSVPAVEFVLAHVQDINSFVLHLNLQLLIISSLPSFGPGDCDDDWWWYNDDGVMMNLRILQWSLGISAQISPTHLNLGMNEWNFLRAQRILQYSVQNINWTVP